MLIAYSYISKGQYYKAISILAFTCVVFRSDVLVLAAPLILELLLRRQISFVKLLAVGLIASIVSVGMG